MSPKKRAPSKNEASTSKRKKVVPKEVNDKANGKKPMVEKPQPKPKTKPTSIPKELDPIVEKLPQYMENYKDEEKRDYIKFKRVQFAPSPSICVTTFKKLGIYEDFLAACERMGILKLATMESKVYEETCREFFSTVKIRYENPTKPRARDILLQFKILGDRFRMPIEEVCEIYGFTNNRRGSFVKFEGATKFWNVIGTGPYGSRMKTSWIRNPTLRILAKFLAQSLFYRHANGNLNHPDLHLLYIGIHNYLLDLDCQPLIPDDPNHEVNLGALFIESMIRVRKSTVDIKKIRMGGFLYPIFERAGYPVKTQYSTTNTTQERMDAAYLARNKVITLENGVPYYTFETSTNKSKTITLPMKEKTEFTCLGHIRFDYEDFENGTVSPPQPLDNDLVGWEIPTTHQHPRTANDRSIGMLLRNQVKIIKKLAYLEKLFSKGKQCFTGSKEKETEDEDEGIMTQEVNENEEHNNNTTEDVAPIQEDVARCVKEVLADINGDVNEVTNEIMGLDNNGEGCSNTHLADEASAIN